MAPRVDLASCMGSRQTIQQLRSHASRIVQAEPPGLVLTNVGEFVRRESNISSTIWIKSSSNMDVVIESNCSAVRDLHHHLVKPPVGDKAGFVAVD